MKKALLIFVFAFLSLLAFESDIYAQKNIEPQVQRDPVLEADSRKNLEVARQYFKLKKAYIGALKRCEETIAANPMFSRMDEVLYIAGLSSLYLAEGKGKQKPVMKNDDDKKAFAPEKLREDAVAYLSQLVETYPNSEFKAEAETILKSLEAKK